MPETVVAAPAQPETPPPALTPAHQAVADNDYLAFEHAERAAKSGTPAPAPTPAEPAKPAPTAAAPAPPTEEQRTVSKRQQDINDRIRDSVDRATADLKAENARLRAQLPPDPKAAAPAPAPAAEKFAKYPDWLEKHPDGDMETWLDERDEWRDQQKETANRQRFERDQHARTFHEEASAYSQRMKAAIAAEPAYLTKVSPDLLALEMPEAEVARAQHEQRAPRLTVLHDIAAVVRQSEVAPQLLRHLTDHPEAFETLRTARNREDLVRRFGRIEARFLDTPAPAADVPPPALPKTVSDAPPPPPTLGTKPGAPADPIKGAVAANDYATFERLEFERAAGVRR